MAMQIGGEPTVYGLGFSRWKRPDVRRFLAPQRVIFVRHAHQVPAGAVVAVWAGGSFGVSWQPNSGIEATHVRSLKRIYLEDGFIRSVGLGADLVRPLSWVVDTQGIYFDATRPSDLETLLQNQVFEPSLRERAQNLRQVLLQANLNKYNVGQKKWVRTNPSEGQQVVLVPGQVETDASIAWGAVSIRTNLALLQAARSDHPNAWILYKPHPDVVAGLRGSGTQLNDARRWCDEVVVDVDMGQLLLDVDKVAVLTSLAGFEALLRGKPVQCYGLPFYAGWGLTQDIHPAERRTRTLHLDELVAAALILYPRYTSLANGRQCQVEQVVQEVVRELLTNKSNVRAKVPFWRKWVRRLLWHP